MFQGNRKTSGQQTRIPYYCSSWLLASVIDKCSAILQSAIVTVTDSQMHLTISRRVTRTEFYSAALPVELRAIEISSSSLTVTCSREYTSLVYTLRTPTHRYARKKLQQDGYIRKGLV